MVRSYALHVPKDIYEIIDLLGMMMIKSPTFIDKRGYFSGRNVETVFHALNEGLDLVKDQLGDPLYMALTEMSARMRAHFEADPEDKTDDTLKGRELIDEMIDLLIQSIRTSGQASPL